MSNELLVSFRGYGFGPVAPLLSRYQKERTSGNRLTLGLEPHNCCPSPRDVKPRCGNIAQRYSAVNSFAEHGRYNPPSITLFHAKRPLAQSHRRVAGRKSGG